MQSWICDSWSHAGNLLVVPVLTGVNEFAFHVVTNRLAKFYFTQRKKNQIHKERKRSSKHGRSQIQKWLYLGKCFRARGMEMVFSNWFISSCLKDKTTAAKELAGFLWNQRRIFKKKISRILPISDNKTTFWANHVSRTIVFDQRSFGMMRTLYRLRTEIQGEETTKWIGPALQNIRSQQGKIYQ